MNLPLQSCRAIVLAPWDGRIKGMLLAAVLLLSAPQASARVSVVRSVKPVAGLSVMMPILTSGLSAGSGGLLAPALTASVLPTLAPLNAADPVVPVRKPPGRGWRGGQIESVDGTPIVYHRRGRASKKSAPRVYVGGLALAQSFDVHFEKGPAPKRLEYRLNLRGLAPSGWSPTREVIDADARDMAAMILTVARESGQTKVELALHSYAAMVLQRMVQLHEEPEIAAALALLKGARVTLFGPTTHIPGSESLMGNSMAMLAWGLRRFIKTIDFGDQLVAFWKNMARFNPLLLPVANGMQSSWSLQRRMMTAQASADIERMLKQDLSHPWPAEIESLRHRVLAEIDEAARDSEWQEAALRRVRDGFDLNFDDESAARLQSLGARIRVVYSHDDALLPWKVERLMLSKLGIDSPESLPPVGTVLTGPKGIEAVIVNGNHYYPLNNHEGVPEHLER